MNLEFCNIATSIFHTFNFSFFCPQIFRSSLYLPKLSCLPFLFKIYISTPIFDSFFSFSSLVLSRSNSTFVSFFSITWKFLFSSFISVSIFTRFLTLTFQCELEPEFWDIYIYKSTSTITLRVPLPSFICSNSSPSFNTYPYSRPIYLISIWWLQPALLVCSLTIIWLLYPRPHDNATQVLP